MQVGFCLTKNIIEVYAVYFKGIDCMLGLTQNYAMIAIYGAFVTDIAQNVLQLRKSYM